MISEAVTIGGVAGPVVVTTHPFWGRPALTVGGQPAPRSGRRRFALPTTTGGTVDATVRTALADPYPILEVNGVRHRTGPTVPVILRILAPLPMLLIAIGGLVGGLLGGLAFVANLAVARTRIPSVAKALIMIGVGVVAFVFLVAVVTALR